MKILILNGPNLNLQGRRNPEIYGTRTFEELFGELKSRFPGVGLDYFQSNHEGVLIDTIQQAEGRYDGIVLNAGGYTHTSVALRDAVAAVSVPVVEVHISSILAREGWRAVDVRALQKQVDALCAEQRRLDNEIQQANWATDIDL